jgi:type I restriction enzyme M protein
LEQQLWNTADKLRKNIDAAEYKHIFLQYISEAFEELHNKLKTGEGEFTGADPEDRDEYKAMNVFLFLNRLDEAFCRHQLNSMELTTSVLTY